MPDKKQPQQVSAKSQYAEVKISYLIPECKSTVIQCSSRTVLENRKAFKNTQCLLSLDKPCFQTIEDNYNKRDPDLSRLGPNSGHELPEHCPLYKCGIWTPFFSKQSGTNTNQFPTSKTFLAGVPREWWRNVCHIITKMILTVYIITAMSVPLDSILKYWIECVSIVPLHSKFVSSARIFYWRVPRYAMECIFVVKCICLLCISSFLFCKYSFTPTWSVVLTWQ